MLFNFLALRGRVSIWVYLRPRICLEFLNNFTPPVNNTTTERHICPGCKLLLVPVFQPGLLIRDKYVYGFCPGLFSTGINVIFRNKKNSARGASFYKSKNWTKTAISKSKSNPQYITHHISRSNSHKKAQDLIHNT